MAINTKGADAYFRNTVKFSIWAAYSIQQKEAGIANAKMLLSHALHRSLNEDETQYTFGDSTRDEYAVYEQAIWMLSNNCQPTGGGVAIPALNGGSNNVDITAKKSPYGAFSVDALRWLGRVTNEVVCA